MRPMWCGLKFVRRARRYYNACPSGIALKLIEKPVDVVQHPALAPCFLIQPFWRAALREPLLTTAQQGWTWRAVVGKSASSVSATRKVLSDGKQ
jgi:hypothetical protein